MDYKQEEVTFYQSNYDYMFISPTPDYEDYYDYNYTDIHEPCHHQNNHSIENVVGPYIHSIICILGFVGNSLVIITYAFYKRTKSKFVLSLPLIVYNELSSWPMGPVACKLLRGSYSVNLYSGMLLLACINTDRYIAIVQARRSFRLRSLTYSRLICTVVWISALLLSFPTFYFYSWYEPSHSKFIMTEEEEAETSSPPQYVCEFKFMNNDMARRTKMAIPSIQLAVGFFVPFLIMVFCYSALIFTLLRAKNFQRHKAVRVVLVVVAVFITCHLPYNMTLIYDTVTMFEEQSCSEADTLHAAKTVTQTIAYLHCCLNPVLYAFVGVKFRNHLRRIIQDLWCLGKRYITPRRFSSNLVDRSINNGSPFTT